jgi:hypothetical protein
VFEGISENQSEKEKVSMAESALSRRFRGLAELFDDDTKASKLQKLDGLEKYKDLIDEQEKLIGQDAKGRTLIAEHRDVYEGFKLEVK